MYELPNWTNLLNNYYVSIRVQRNNKRIVRQYYRLVEKEKLRLAEQGINQEKIRIACRYLAMVQCVRCYQCKCCERMIKDLKSEEMQLQLDLISILEK